MLQLTCSDKASEATDQVIKPSLTLDPDGPGFKSPPATHSDGHITSMSFNFVTPKMKDKSTSLQGPYRGPRDMMHVGLLTESAGLLTNNTVAVFDN